MDKYVLLRFAHLIGLMLMSAGLIGVFVADMRSRQVRDVKLLAQAVMFIAVFYDGLVVPCVCRKPRFGNIGDEDRREQVVM